MNRRPPPPAVTELDPDGLRLSLRERLEFIELRLYWEGRITLIDFPQVVSLHRNSRAISILERDVERICEYFAGQGVTSTGNIPCDPAAIMSRLRKRYFSRQRLNTEADYSRFQVEDE